MMKKRKRTLWLLFDRTLSKSFAHQMSILFMAFIVALGLSYLLMWVSDFDWSGYCKDKDISPLAMPFFLLIDANALNTMYAGNGVSTGLLTASTIVFLLGMFIFNGMIISLMTNAIENRVKNKDAGLIHYLNSGHYIIMGYDDIVPSIILHILKKDSNAYVLVMSSVATQTIREHLQRSVVAGSIDRIIVNYGSRTTTAEYEAIHLEKAQELFIAGNRQKATHDATNVECVESVCHYLKECREKDSTVTGPVRITCVFEDIDTYTAFKVTDIFDKVKDLNIEFVPYNFYAAWAHRVLVSRRYGNKAGTEYTYPAVYGSAMKPDDDTLVHIVLVGTTLLNTQVAIEAAHTLHFTNYNRCKTLITFIDKNAEQEETIFRTRNRHYFEVQDGKDVSSILDVTFEFIKGDIFSANVQNTIAQWATDKNRLLSIFLAMSDQRLNFAIGMNMPDVVYDNGVPIFIRQDRSDNFVTNLRIADQGKELPYSCVSGKEKIATVVRHGRYANIYPFGMSDVAFEYDEQAYRQAKLINYLYETADYANDAYRFTPTDQLDAMDANDIWKEAEEKWGKLTVALQWSSLYCAYNIPCKLASLRTMRNLSPDDETHDQDDITAKEVDILARVEHNRWCVEKLLMGFRPPTNQENKYNHPKHAAMLVKNKKLFIHHDLCPYDQLDAVKKLDVEIVNHIPWILRMTQQIQ
jgi:hypothetical protein